MESWSTKRMQTHKGRAPARPMVVIVLEPNLSEMRPTMGENRAGMTRQMKMSPAPELVQWNVSFVKRGRTESKAPREFDCTKQPSSATRIRGTRSRVMTGGSLWVHFGRGRAPTPACSGSAFSDMKGSFNGGRGCISSPI